jgi:hypothetical protein
MIATIIIILISSSLVPHIHILFGPDPRHFRRQLRHVFGPPFLELVLVRLGLTRGRPAGWCVAQNRSSEVIRTRKSRRFARKDDVRLSRPCYSNNASYLHGVRPIWIIVLESVFNEYVVALHDPFSTKRFRILQINDVAIPFGVDSRPQGKRVGVAYGGRDEVDISA